MSRLYGFGVGSFIGLALVLALLLPLAVPNDVLADAGSGPPPAGCMPDKCTLRNTCQKLGKKDCAELTSCGLDTGCVDVCSCQPSGANCDCQ